MCKEFCKKCAVWQLSCETCDSPDVSKSAELACHRRTKVKLHTELNEAFAVLLNLCLELELRNYHKSLLSGRSFMSGVVDNSELPSV